MTSSTDRSVPCGTRAASRILVMCLALLSIAVDAFGYGFDSFGGVQGRNFLSLPTPAGRRWTNNNFTWNWNTTGAPTVGGPGLPSNAQILAAMNSWATAGVNITFAATPTTTSPEINISWGNHGAGGPLALATPSIGGGSVTGSTIVFNNNAALTWTQQGILNALAHEFGHSLGLVDGYNANNNTVEDFIDHGPGGDGPTGAAKGWADNVMNGFGTTSPAAARALDNDDVYGAIWLWGSTTRNTIATAAWNTTLGSDPGPDGTLGSPPGQGAAGMDDYVNYYQVADHHGADGTNTNTWEYRGTVGLPTTGGTMTSIQIPARGVNLANTTFLVPGGPTGWTQAYAGGVYSLTGPAGFTGNYQISLFSTATAEALVTAQVNATTFANVPTRTGIQAAPQIWAPVPEPASMCLFACCGVLVILGMRQQRVC